MKAIISSTTDPKYFFFIPIVTWCWNKIGVDTLCFLPTNQGPQGGRELHLLDETIEKAALRMHVSFFNCAEDAEPTYSQVSRLFGAATGLFDQNERLITADADMAVFGQYLLLDADGITVFGADLLEGMQQIPMCYISMRSKTWIDVMNIRGDVQTCLNLALSGEIVNKDMRGNLWSRDQEMAYNFITASKERKNYIPRAPNRCGRKEGQYFAENRVDRDDTNWRSYLGPNLIDAHLWRPGYTDQNFANILELLQTQYPEDKFDWLIYYRNEYIKLL